VPSTTLLKIPPAEQAQMRAILRRARYKARHAFISQVSKYLCGVGATMSPPNIEGEMLI
jgi:hypothetical protein